MQKKRPNERFSSLHLSPFTRRYKNMLQRLGIYSPRRVAVLLPHEMLLNHVV